jgi:class 3 adenylate cyclase
VGTVYLYGSSLPATLLTLVTAGSRAMFERMARLTSPGRRQAAVLFADVEASGALSRRLSSAAYFDLIRRLTTAMDALVIDRQGIVGKHAGDGVTAFFLAEDLGSASEAAFACLDTARALAAVARETAATTERVEPSDLRMNVGVHWGSTLYMGQVVTGGRLEVTALGDEVNECARLEQAASGGEVLASKTLVEQLSLEDAAKLGLDVERAAYTAVADLPGISDKVMRDAGTIAVTRLRS